MKDKGILILCASPIGNLEDITLRAIRNLEEADYIIAEDTRHSLKLLNHLGINKPLISYHEHSSPGKEEEIIGLIEEGKSLVLLSDAGMPGISDPGERLVSLAWERSLRVTVLPGPSAGISALVLSGLSSSKFVFEGFLPKKRRDRLDRIDFLKYERRTIILYVSPHSLLKTLKELLDILGDREIAIVRELTKKYEEIKKFRISEGLEYYSEKGPRGEFVLVLEGSKEPEKSDIDDKFKNLSIKDHIQIYMDEGLTRSEAVKKVADERELPRNQVYQKSLNME